MVSTRHRPCSPRRGSRFAVPRGTREQVQLGRVTMCVQVERVCGTTRSVTCRVSPSENGPHVPLLSENPRLGGGCQAGDRWALTYFYHHPSGYCVFRLRKGARIEESGFCNNRGDGGHTRAAAIKKVKGAQILDMREGRGSRI